jgi:hypothetical protein
MGMTITGPDAAKQAVQRGGDVLDVARPDTWPTRVRDLVDVLARVTSPSSYVSDLRPPDDADTRVRAVLAGERLRAYHATRLFDHECGTIVQQGLRVFGSDLFEDRIRAALTHGAISEAEHDTLLATHMYATGEAHSRGRREGLVCLILRDHVFDDDTSSVARLLSTWGGEGIYFSQRGVELEQWLRCLGRPTIVVTAVPVLPDEAHQLAFPDLARLMVGAVRGIRLAGDLHHPQPIPGTDVLELWQPGDERYDRFPRLPRS